MEKSRREQLDTIDTYAFFEVSSGVSFDALESNGYMYSLTEEEYDILKEAFDEKIVEVIASEENEAWETYSVEVTPKTIMLGLTEEGFPFVVLLAE